MNLDLGTIGPASLRFPGSPSCTMVPGKPGFLRECCCLIQGLSRLHLLCTRVRGRERGRERQIDTDRD